MNKKYTITALNNLTKVHQVHYEKISNFLTFIYSNIGGLFDKIDMDIIYYKYKRFYWTSLHTWYKVKLHDFNKLD